jgi:hypothetical protein
MKVRKDYTIKIVPAATKNPEDAEKLQVVLITDAMKQGYTFAIPRERKVLDDQDIEDLLRGELSGDVGLQEVNRIAGKVSKWLLGTDFDPTLYNAFSELKNEQLRLIFTVDDRLNNLFDMSSVPVELIRRVPRGPDDDDGSEDTLYALSPKVAAILHLLEKIGIPEQNTMTWPLRVLLVRSDPADLFEAVPDALTISNEIKKHSIRLGPAAIRIDVLSREKGIGIPATWKNFTSYLKNAYHILVYLGHADLKQEGAKSVGYLQFESEDGQGHEDIPARLIKAQLENQQMPVPVVLLVGCLTAAQRDKLDDEGKKDLDAKMKQTIRGGHGVAQALINSHSPVQIAIGMRYRLWSEDAKTFLSSFFESLLTGENTKGNVEAAVKHTRLELFNSTYKAAYSAPVIFRAIKSAQEDEPIFKFLEDPPPPQVIPPGDADLERIWRPEPRLFLWDDLQSIAWETRLPEVTEERKKKLDDLEQRLIADTLKTSPLVMPTWALAKPGQEVTVAVNLYGSLEMTGLTGKLLVDKSDLVIKEVNATKHLADNGYKLDTPQIDGRQVSFSIKPTLIGAGKTLPGGPLFELKMVLGSAFPLRYALRVADVLTTPLQPVYSGTNVVIVPP